MRPPCLRSHRSTIAVAAPPNHLADLCRHCGILVLPYAGHRSPAGLLCRRCGRWRGLVMPEGRVGLSSPLA
jgi:hypothetical protein